MPVYHSIRVCSTSSSQNEKTIHRDLAARQFEELRTIDLDRLAVLTVTGDRKSRDRGRDVEPAASSARSIIRPGT
jgi:hypothetical protein